MIRPTLLAFTALLVVAPAFAFNHVLTVTPTVAGPYTVACSNIAQDTSRMAPGTVPSDYWEGHLVNDQLLYIDQILASPLTAVTYQAVPPNDPSIYPNTANTHVPFVALICHPTPDSNADPGYTLPGSTDVVPHMQPAGAAPKLIASQQFPLVVYSHGLGGSPIGSGYIDSMVALASNGYVVAAPFHADARFSRVRVNDLSDFVYLFTQYDRVAEMMLMRPVALKAMTDLLLAHPQYSLAVDPNRIAGFGASLGGQAIANLMGAKLTTSIGLTCRETVQDPRMKVGVGYVPYAGQSFLPAFCDGQSGAAGVTRPFLGISGTADTTAPINLAQQAINRFQGSHYLVELIDGQHELRPEDVGDLFTWMVTFYKAYLEEQPAAYAKLFQMDSVVGGREDHLIVDSHWPANLGANEERVTELHNNIIDRYFLEPDASEVTSILQGSAGPGWSTTGYAFKAFTTLPVDTSTCLYEPAARVGAALGNECGYTKRLGRWVFDEPGGFYIEGVDVTGQCASGRLSVNRLYRPALALSRNVSSQRFVTSDSAAREMIGHGWIALPATMCARY